MKSIFDQVTRDEVINRINILSTDSKAQWGTMTIGQMIRHCTICEDYYFGKIKVKRSWLGMFVGRSAINSILKNDSTTIGRNAPTAREFKVTEAIQGLNEEKERWKSAVNRYATFGDNYFAHWFFGKMTKEELGQFIYKHCDHHLKQFGS
ncbi:MAG TPA: DinB family protein [Cyclobacteriaceae bacterium]|jgi:hypothetical protein|nr:DinB family protein [Cyclobacteriaceae bacterium]